MTNRTENAIAPALTPQEWAQYLVRGFITRGVDEHAAAALALHGQPFGFTWAMYDALKAACDQWLTDVHDETASMDATPDVDPDYRRIYAGCKTALENIAALLPPRF